MMDILMYPLATEKAINMIERKNVIIYAVDRRAKKDEIKKAFENTFKVKVAKINVAIDPKNVKKAFITLGKEFKASDIALKLRLV